MEPDTRLYPTDDGVGGNLDKHYASVVTYFFHDVSKAYICYVIVMKKKKNNEALYQVIPYSSSLVDVTMNLIPGYTLLFCPY